MKIDLTSKVPTIQYILNLILQLASAGKKDGSAFYSPLVLSIAQKENINLNDFFDQVYLINLKRRPDKLKVCQQLFVKLNIKYKIFEAIDFCDGIPEDYPV